MATESYTGKINRKLNKKLRIVEVAAGRQKADLVLKNAAYVNVFTNEICHGDIAVAEGLIVGMGAYSGQQEVDMAGRIVLPGFIPLGISCYLSASETGGCRLPDAGPDNSFALLLSAASVSGSGSSRSAVP